MERSEEARLLSRAKGGDADAFEALVTENERLVYSVCVKMLKHEQDAQDAAQETFIKAFTSLASFRGESRFSVWLYRMASNVCIDMLRKNAPAEVSLSAEDDEGGERELELPDTRCLPENELEKKELREAVREGLMRLPPESRQILVLREIGGESYEEISASLGLDLGTVKSRLFRARKKLCAVLTESGNIFAPDASNDPKGGARI